MADEVKFNIDSNALKVAKETKKLVDQQRKAVAMAKKHEKAQARLQLREDKLTSSLKKRTAAMSQQHRAQMRNQGVGGAVRRGGRAAASGASTAGGIAGAVGLGAAVSGLREATAEALQFSDTMTGLLSLGNNAQNFEAIKNSVEDLSISSGKSVAEVAEAMFTLQSATSNLSDSIRDDLMREAIELSKVNGSQLGPTLMALVKTYQIYGSEVKSVADLQNKLQLTAQRGVLTFKDMATFLPEVASSAQAMGFSLDEVNAALVVATQKGGRTETTFTGLRNVFLRMTDAEKKGIELTGTFAEKIEQLSKVDKNILKDLFGAESIAVINTLTTSVGQFNNELALTKNIQGDIAGQTLAQRKRNDPFFKLSEDVNRKRRVTEQFKRDPEMAKIGSDFETQWEVFKVGMAGMLTGNFKKGIGAGTRFNEINEEAKLADLGNAALGTSGTMDDIRAIQDISGADRMTPKLLLILEKLEKSLSGVSKNNKETSIANRDSKIGKT